MTDTITKEEFKQFQNAIVTEILDLKKAALQKDAEILELKFLLERFMYHLIDDKKITSSKELIEYGNKNEYVQLYQKEQEIFANFLKDFDQINQDEKKYLQIIHDIGETKLKRDLLFKIKLESDVNIDENTKKELNDRIDFYKGNLETIKHRLSEISK